MRDFYVDDLLTGAETVEDTLTLRDEILEILRRGAFKLRKWSSNDKRLLNNMPGEGTAEVRFDGEVSSRVLGILWNPARDGFRFAIESTVASKR